MVYAHTQQNAVFSPLTQIRLHDDWAGSVRTLHTGRVRLILIGAQKFSQFSRQYVVKCAGLIVLKATVYYNLVIADGDSFPVAEHAFQTPEFSR